MSTFLEQTVKDLIMLISSMCTTQRDLLFEPSIFCGQCNFGYYIGSVGKHYMKQQILNFKLTDTVTW